MRILRALWNAVTAAKNVFTNLLFLAIVIAIIIGITSQDGPSIPESGALVLNPTGFIVEQKQAIDPFAEFFSNSDDESETALRDILDAIRDGATDKRIKALVLQLDGMAGASMSMLEEIGAAVDEFRESGKPVYAFGRSFSQGQYFIAAHADELYLDSHSFSAFGGVLLTGFGSYPTYFKSALDKLNINVHVFKVGTYKSAVEPYLRDDMSPESKENNLEWLGQLWSSYADGVIEERELTREDFSDYTNEYDVLLESVGGDGVQLALQEGLIDDQMTREAFERKLADLVGKNAKGDYAGIGFRDYLRVQRPPIPMPTPGASQIAVITGKGTILDGEQAAGSIGGETMAKMIKDARENSAVKAVVLRIDSPGGSAAASERIRAQLAMTQRAGKPVVVSMSGVAASGGYWISATANKIFAMPSTITGSIGTFIVFPNFTETLSNVGVNSDGVGTTAMSGALDLTRPLNPVIERTLQLSVNNTYDKFLSIVAEGRNMTTDDVDKIAQGRVWSGTSALELGLVDAIGNLEDAIDSAALLADISNYEVMYIQKELSPREQIMQQIMNASLTVIRAGLDQVLGGVTVPLPGRFSALNQLSADMKSLIAMSQSQGIHLQCLSCRVSM